LPIRGGAADKIGNRYERRWTILALLNVLTGDADYLQVEVPGEAGYGFEFVLSVTGVSEWHQVKRGGPWKIASMRDVLAPWWPKIQEGGRCVFVSTAGAEELNELVERAAAADSWRTFDEHFLDARTQRDRFARLCEAWGNTDGPAAYQALKEVGVCTIGEPALTKLLEARLATLVTGKPSVVAAVLGRLIDDSTHRRLTAAEVWSRLAEEGFYPLSADEQGAPGLRQIIHGLGSSIHIVGDSNIVSVRQGRSSPPRPTARIVALAVVLAAGTIAAYGALRDSSSQAATSTELASGPATDISVAPPDSKCGNTPQAGFLSPAKVAFKSVSVVFTLSIDDGSASIMRGTYDDQVYEWIQSHPTGPKAGMWLSWQVNTQQPPHYCELTIPSGPASSLPERVASVAVPAVIAGESVTFAACLWRGQPIFEQKCSGNLQLHADALESRSVRASPVPRRTPRARWTSTIRPRCSPA
jgi:hypothetical protein